MKIQLTKDGLKVNKFECQSVTVYKLEDGTFRAELFRIKGITKEESIISKYNGKQETNWNGTPLFKTRKLKKTIKSKTLEYSGIPMRDSTIPYREQKAMFATNGEKSNYINYYEPLNDVKGGLDE